MRSPLQSCPCSRPVPGFTLVELLVVITIVVTLAVMAMVGLPGFIDRGRKVQALAAFKDLAVGFAGFEAENNRPLIPYEQRVAGQDTLYGVPRGKYSNGIVVAVLGGASDNLAYRLVDFKIKDINPKEEAYMRFKFATTKVNGVGPDGVFYDPWGKPLMFAVNAFKSTNPGAVLVELNTTMPGKNDSRLDTQGLAEYSDTKPGDDTYVIWSYGKDGKKGSETTKTKKLPRYQGSNDVVSWK
jgi:prepilin-type N-terminal cleavage/methylation domain-containing protein